MTVSTIYTYRPLVPIYVELDRDDIELAGQIALKRRAMNRTANIYQPLGWSETPWDNEMEGALGEYAVAKEFRLFWNGNLGNPRAPDVGPLQVRTTRRSDGWLMVKKDDPVDDDYVLVRGGDGRYHIVAYCNGRDAKRLEFWRDSTTMPRLDPAAYLVDTQPALKHIQELRTRFRGAA